jgi:hypothetical protein
MADLAKIISFLLFTFYSFILIEAFFNSREVHGGFCKRLFWTHWCFRGVEIDNRLSNLEGRAT